MKKLAVIILNWNGRKLLEQFIPTAVKHTSDDEVDLIVADNGSDDDSLTWLEKNHPEVKTIRLEKNYGFAEGYNRAIEETSRLSAVCRWLSSRIFTRYRSSTSRPASARQRKTVPGTRTPPP